MNNARTKPNFKELGLRSTPVRRTILKILEGAKQPLSVDELFDLLKKSEKKKKFDLVTLYRNLKSFELAGLVLALDLGMGKLFYEYKGSHHHHHHIVCEGCSKIEHVDICGLDIHFKMLERMGYKNLSHKLEFFGLCKACS